MNRIKESVLKSLKESKDKDPFKTVFVFNNVRYTADLIIKEIEGGTPLGNYFLDQVVATSVDMITRGKV